MVRRHSTSLRHWAWGLTLTLGCATLVEQSTMAAPPSAPANLDDLTAEAAPEVSAQGTEIIRERYPNRALKIERHVAQDGEGNFVNHGPWSMWDEQERLMGGGSYRHGLRHGKWMRYYNAGEAEVLSSSLVREFTAPFTSEATFVDGDLHGKWTITDAQDRLVSCSSFDHGQRDGKSAWYYPNGQKWREIDYHDNDVDGSLIEWAPSGRVIAKEVYVEGRRQGVKIEWYSPGIKKVEAEFLFAREVTQVTDDWWAGISRNRVVKKEGQDERHGTWTTFYRNGQKALEGKYEHDVPSGTFVWWHPNGQRAIQGEYAGGKQSGTWSWWHDNGQRHIVGEYDRGRQSGDWNWWTDDGMKAESASFDFMAPQNMPRVPKLETVEAPPDLHALPSEKQPTERQSSRRTANRRSPDSTR